MSKIALLMKPSKKTPNKLRWQLDVEGIVFALYIPKWRVPIPWPKRIIVHISDVPAETIPKQPSTSVEHPISVIVEKVIEHTQTVRFAPRGNPEEWEIGEPYIPYGLLPTLSTQCLQIDVEWDRSIGEWFDDSLVSIATCA